MEGDREDIDGVFEGEVTYPHPSLDICKGRYIIELRER